MSKWQKILILVLVFIDQLTKFFIRQNFELHESRPVTSFFSLTYIHNTGIAFGLFQNEKFSLEINFSPLRRIISQMGGKDRQFKKDYSFKPRFTLLGTIFFKDNFKFSYFYTYQFDTLIFPEKNFLT
mgnify:CR=1 FL=1